MIFEQIAVGGDRNFAYLIGDKVSGEAAIIDPSFNPQLVLDRACKHGLKIKYLIITHDHPDHVNGNEYVLSHCDAELVSASLGAGTTDGQQLFLGDLSLRIISTPGHTVDSICILVKDCLLTGDTLFVGKVGGTFTDEDALAEYTSLHDKLLVLDNKITVYPGHDYGNDKISTIGYERAHNPFLLCKSFDDFLFLKKNWAQYKKEHNIN